MDHWSWNLLANWALVPFLLPWPVVNDNLAEVLGAYVGVTRLLASTCPPPSSPLQLNSPRSLFPSFLSFSFTVPLSMFLASHISHVLLLHLPLVLCWLPPSFISLLLISLPLSLSYCWVTVQLNCYWVLRRAQSSSSKNDCIYIHITGIHPCIHPSIHPLLLIRDTGAAA